MTGGETDAKTDSDGLECGDCGRGIERGEWHTLLEDGTRRCWDCEDRERERGDFPGVVAEEL